MPEDKRRATAQARALQKNIRTVEAVLRREEPDPEMLVDGQEEVFARSEVEHGTIEHKTSAGDKVAAPNDRRIE